ncbi:aldo/keto reductase [Roseibium sp. MMSF_3412]|uniref:aldo/keto reductase n=1 Tax=Roseibium sp. MMSF_3412 TaxID=3046712 RepID=UPI00273CF78F|nr:aldo/keto reductase [Roseibium sp. MMSF_3412]
MNAVSELPGVRKTKESGGTADKLVLGTAQLGLDYGIASARAPDRAESIEIIHTAIAGGVRTLDTARAYGRSEDVIGAALADYDCPDCQIVTKLSPLGEIQENADAATARSAAESSLEQSSHALRKSHLDTVLFHRVSHVQAWNASVFNLARDWQSSGRIGSIGASVQSVDELETVLDIDEISHIQMPYNMLDRRWNTAIERIKAEQETRNLTIHIRSVFLQGLLMSSEAALWRRAHVHDPSPIVEWLESLCRNLGQRDIASLCLSWARAHNWVQGVVVGCDNLDQLRDNLDMFSDKELSQDDLLQIRKSCPDVAEETLNPAMWTN